MKKKILIVTECFYPEEFKINDVFNSWIEDGNYVDVLTMTPTYPFGRIFKQYKNKFPYSTDYINDSSIFRAYAITGYKESFIKKLLRFLSFMIIGSYISLKIGRKYDYVFGFNTGALTSMLPAVIIHKIYKKKLVFWVQDIWPDSLFAYGLPKSRFNNYVLSKFVKFVYKDIHSLAISSNGFKNKLKPYVRANVSFNYIPNWADNLDCDTRSFSFSEDQLVHFTFAGNVGKLQNLRNIIKSFFLLPPEIMAKCQLNIIGDGDELNNLKDIVSNHSCAQIKFHGRIKSTNIAKFLYASDFLIVSLVDEPAFSFTVPSKTQTYIAAKKPIFGIIKGETADIINKNNIGFCADPNNLYEIRDIFIKFYNLSDNEKSKLIENNENLMNNYFSKEKNIKQLLQLLIEDKNT